VSSESYNLLKIVDGRDKPGHDGPAEALDKRGALAWDAGLAHHRLMVGRRQADLFGEEGQAELFGEPKIPAYRPPDLDKVRARLHELLAETRSAQSLPWERAAILRAIFPRMTLWLPEDEGAQLRLAFAQEMLRLEAA
jgi:hypothetical protein